MRRGRTALSVSACPPRVTLVLPRLPKPRPPITKGTPPVSGARQGVMSRARVAGGVASSVVKLETPLER